MPTVPITQWNGVLRAVTRRPEPRHFLSVGLLPVSVGASHVPLSSHSLVSCARHWCGRRSGDDGTRSESASPRGFPPSFWSIPPPPHPPLPAPPLREIVKQACADAYDVHFNRSTAFVFLGGQVDQPTGREKGSHARLEPTAAVRGGGAEGSVDQASSARPGVSRSEEGGVGGVRLGLASAEGEVCATSTGPSSAAADAHTLDRLRADDADRLCRLLRVRLCVCGCVDHSLVYSCADRHGPPKYALSRCGQQERAVGDRFTRSTEIAHTSLRTHHRHVCALARL